jgi:hypothetical protein
VQHLDRVANANPSAFHDAAEHSPAPAQLVFQSRAHVFHAFAGMADDSDFEQRFSDAQPLAGTQTTHIEVARGDVLFHLAGTEVHFFERLEVEQKDLAQAAGLGVGAAGKPAIGYGLQLAGRPHRQAVGNATKQVCDFRHD